MKKIALVYDFDYTLADGYHPTSILESRGINAQEFWNKVAQTQQRELAQGEKTALDIIYLAHFMHEIRNGKLKGLTNNDLKESGKDVNKTLYAGMPEFFNNIKDEHKDAHISHNIVTVGIRTILQGSIIAKHVDNIYGYTFFDDLTEGDGIDEIRSTTSRAEKVRSVISISYGKSEKGFEYPIDTMIYFGDGQTNIPVFRFVKKKRRNKHSSI